jgi:hypothetical protein
MKMGFVIFIIGVLAATVIWYWKGWRLGLIVFAVTCAISIFVFQIPALVVFVIGTILILGVFCFVSEKHGGDFSLEEQRRTEANYKAERAKYNADGNLKRGYDYYSRRNGK